VTSIDPERLAQSAYEAYRDARRGSVPAWEDAGQQEQQAWRAAVSAVSGPGDVTLTDGAPAQSLILLAGDDTRIFHSEFTAGRQGSLAVNDDHASSHHARFLFAHGFWYVEDLDSTNGTFLNGRRMYNAQRLKKGDKIRIGRTIIAVLGV
jgi:pSer/pThr/pTyr-binding forkhead associated (FHA) protein